MEEKMKKYDYYYNDVVFRVADGKTERYDGGGKWVETQYDVVARATPSNVKYDFGETSKEDEKEALRLIKMHDDTIELRRKNGWYD